MQPTLERPGALTPRTKRGLFCRLTAIVVTDPRCASKILVMTELPTSAELLGGDAHAFAAFYRRHEDAVLGYFLRCTRDAELAADLTAEAFARALAGRRGFDAERGDAGAWLFCICRNLLAASLKRGQVENDTRERLGLERLSLDDEAIARIEELHDAPAVSALDALPEEQRVAVRERVIEERGYEALAAELRCSQSVVRQRVSRGLRTLRARLEADR